MERPFMAARILSWRLVVSSKFRMVMLAMQSMIALQSMIASEHVAPDAFVRGSPRLAGGRMRPPPRGSDVPLESLPAHFGTLRISFISKLLDPGDCNHPRP